jgi:membrane protease YdiL (CAAX protease family)
MDESGGITPGQRRRATIFLCIAGGILWIPLGRKLLGVDVVFLRNLWPADAGSSWLAWSLALVVAVLYSGFFVLRGPPTVRGWWRLNPLKLLAIVMSVADAIVEEAFFRRLVMDMMASRGGGAMLQILASGAGHRLAFPHRPGDPSGLDPGRLRRLHGTTARRGGGR